MRLFRPCGLEEMLLVRRLGVWPARLPEQPIFYPVLHESYADQISREWNAPMGAGFGYVTTFQVDDAFASAYTPQIVGHRGHAELWVPAGELDAFNAHISGGIEITRVFVGRTATGVIPSVGPWRGLDMRAQQGWMKGGRAAPTVGTEEALWAHVPVWRAMGMWSPGRDGFEVVLAQDERRPEPSRQS